MKQPPCSGVGLQDRLTALVCLHQRFHHVAADRRLALVVAEDAAESAPPSLDTRWGEAGANVVSSMQLAVERSLPGHTIFVEPGRHHVAHVHIRCVPCVVARCLAC